MGWGRQPSICESVEDWAAGQPGMQCRTLFPPRQITRELPRTIEAEVRPEYLTRKVADQRGRYLVPIPRARLVGPNGLVVLPDGKLALEPIYTRAVLERDPRYRSQLRRPTVAKEGDYFSLIVVWSRSGNYYHWLHDTLGRIYGVVEWLPPDTKYIVPANMTPIQRETLNAVGIGDHQVIPFTGDETWELETLHFAPPTTNSGSHRQEADHWLRDTMMRTQAVDPAAADRRIFVSRRAAPSRRLVNEPEVEQLLRDFGFETHVTEELSLREQMELFSQAAVVVSTHGAGFTNMLFSPPGLQVVDIIEPGKFDWSYVFWTMADELNHEYWYFVADSVPRPGHANDTFVPLEKLAATLEAMQLDPMP